MPPPNLSDATAIEITSLPYEVTTDPENNTNELWYKYTALAGDTPLIGAHIYGTGGVYKPQIVVQVGAEGAEVDHPYGFGYYATQKAILIPVDEASIYWFRIKGGSGSSYSAGQTFTLSVYNAPSENPPRGSLLVPDDTNGFPAVILDSETGDVLRYVAVASGEFGDSLPTGEVLTEDTANLNDLKLYDRQMNLIATLSGYATSTLSIRTNGSDRFYASSGTTLRAVDAEGTLIDTWGPLAVTPIAMAPARDDTIAYYAQSGASRVVRRWDLVNDVALSDLAPAVTNYLIGTDMFVLADGTILVHYFKTSGGVDHFLRRYNPDGTTAQDYAFGTSAINRVSAYDDDHVVVWQQSGGQGTFKRMLLSDGTFPVSFSQYDYVTGVSEQTATASPQTFGHSFSCTAMPFNGSFDVPILDPSDPCCTDFSTFPKGLSGCDTGPRSGAGSSGPLEPPAAGTWTNTLNATSGTGGASGTAWYRPDPVIDESWGN